MRQECAGCVFLEYSKSRIWLFFLSGSSWSSFPRTISFSLFSITWIESYCSATCNFPEWQIMNILSCHYIGLVHKGWIFHYWMYQESIAVFFINYLYNHFPIDQACQTGMQPANCEFDMLALDEHFDCFQFLARTQKNQRAIMESNFGMAIHIGSMYLHPCSCIPLSTENLLSCYLMLCACYMLKIQWWTCACALACKGRGDGKYFPLKFKVGGFVLKFTNTVHIGDFALNVKGSWKLDSKKGKRKRRKINYTYLSWSGKLLWYSQMTP